MTEKKQVEKIAEKLEQENRGNQEVTKSVTSKLVGGLKKLNQRILDSNGFMTSKGKYLSKPEWHAMAIPVSFISSAFILPKLGIVIFGTFFLMYRRGFKLAEDPNYEGHWNDVIDESAYTGGAMLLTIIYWVYLRPETIGGFEMFSGAIARLFIGA